MTAIFKKLSIRNTSILFGVVGLMTVMLSGLIGHNSRSDIDTMVSSIDRCATVFVSKWDLLSHITAKIGNGGAVYSFTRYAMQGEQADADNFSNVANEVTKAIGDFRNYELSEAEDTALNRIEGVINGYRSLLPVIGQLYAEGKREEAIGKALMVDNAAAFDAVETLHQELKTSRAEHQKTVMTNLQDVERSVDLATFSMPVIVFSLVFAMIWVLFGIRRVIGGEPQVVELVSNRVAEGDLAVLDDFNTSQVSGVLDSTLRSVDAVSSVIEKTRDSAEKVDTSAISILDKANDLKSRFNHQRDNIEHTASTIEQMTGITYENARRAEEANKLAGAVTESTVRGSKTVNETTAAMEEINAASQKISDIISIIDEIAFQTNLLALNAAVEAARAGEHGKGFAVVATEVRNLAQRSATAAKEIEHLIDDSSAKVKDGVLLVKNAGESLNEIFHSVDKVNAVVAQMAASNREQAEGVDAINRAMEQIEKVRASNAAQVDEIAAECSLMQLQALDLRRNIGFFHTGRKKASRPDFIATPVQSQSISATDFSQPASDEESWRQPEMFTAESSFPEEETTLSHQESAIDTQGWDGIERRSAKRPWSDSPQQRVTEKKIDDQDWDSF